MTETTAAEPKPETRLKGNVTIDPAKPGTSPTSSGDRDRDGT